MEINKNYANELTVGTQFFENIPGGDYAGEIYVMNADGTGQTNISNNPAFDHGPSSSPDGTKIAFTSQRGISNNNNEIFVMNADGTGQTKIIFASDRDAITNRDLYVMNADGSNPTRLTNDPEDETWPSWSPDGTKIAFTRNGQIYVMNADGSEQTNISGGRFGIDPDWGPAVDTD